MTRLSDTQTLLLSAAAARTNRSLLPVPETLKATGKVLERALAALVKRGLATESRARNEAATRLTDWPEPTTRRASSARPSAVKRAFLWLFIRSSLEI